MPDQPVISPLSGAIFEKRIIEKYVMENGCDPINGKDLKVEDLIEIKSKFSDPNFKRLFASIITKRFAELKFLPFPHSSHLST